MMAIDPMIILDSGNRREFESGAVRDMAEGKGRCDLLPLDVLYPEGGSDVLRYLQRYQETKDSKNLSSAFHRFYKDFLHIDHSTALLELAIHFEDGAKKYGENNWQKGIPEWCYIDSAIRHYLKWERGDKDERHDRAVLWNLACLMWTIKHKEGE